ncbi:16S rRNA (guanine(966)-N(2))-methyltransferase RsmD [Almyronema epifaneia]|uniref:16S rRNA (Guanine(966)-N(2))-methyltransferase RsmD n=1 Tax=Almyronema epifaneia S1 TaxID=2991925 RepID=A0ABW6IC99_9CYAN
MPLRIYGNRLLKTLPGSATRPTSARVREALFNIWQGYVAGCCWLDLCAGSGAMGAEALARGALEVVGVEQSGSACRVIRENWQRLAQPQQQYEIRRGDVQQQILKLRGRSFDRIYFDPPYASPLYASVLPAIAELSLLAPAGELAVEHRPESWSAQAIAGLEIIRQKRYGDTTLTFYVLAASGKPTRL